MIEISQVIYIGLLAIALFVLVIAILAIFVRFVVYKDDLLQAEKDDLDRREMAIKEREKSFDILNEKYSTLKGKNDEFMDKYNRSVGLCTDYAHLIMVLEYHDTLPDEIVKRSKRLFQQLSELKDYVAVDFSEMLKSSERESPGFIADHFSHFSTDKESGTFTARINKDPKF